VFPCNDALSLIFYDFFFLFNRNRPCKNAGGGEGLIKLYHFKNNFNFTYYEKRKDNIPIDLLFLLTNISTQRNKKQKQILNSTTLFICTKSVSIKKKNLTITNTYYNYVTISSKSLLGDKL
jgi:hypothetical protein